MSDLKKELKDYAMVTAKPNEKSVHVRFPHSGYYKLSIYAEREDEKYDFGAAFLLQCTVPKLHPNVQSTMLFQFVKMCVNL